MHNYTVKLNTKELGQITVYIKADSKEHAKHKAMQFKSYIKCTVVEVLTINKGYHTIG